MRTLICLFAMVMVTSAVSAAPRGDIPVEELPAEVKTVLLEYVKILRTSKDLDEAATRFVAIAGGGLVNEDGKSLRGSVKPFGLKKDYTNIRVYADPLSITRVNKSKLGQSGFGDSAIGGTKYKIWIGKAAGKSGVPAPVSILVPEGHKTITTPKVINVGSF